MVCFILNEFHVILLLRPRAVRHAKSCQLITMAWKCGGRPKRLLPSASVRASRRSNHAHLGSLRVRTRIHSDDRGADPSDRNAERAEARKTAQFRPRADPTRDPESARSPVSARGLSAANGAGFAAPAPPIARAARRRRHCPCAMLTTSRAASRPFAGCSPRSLARMKSAMRGNLGTEARAVEHAVVADRRLQLVALSSAGRLRAQGVRRLGLADAGDVVVLALDRHQGDVA